MIIAYQKKYNKKKKKKYILKILLYTYDRKRYKWKIM